MSDEDQISRRTALKVIAIAGTLPLLEETALGQGHSGMAMPKVAPAQAPRFFNGQELAAITILSDLIIPADEHSPGAKEAGVTEFIDQMVSESSTETKKLWRDGLAAINQMCRQKFSSDFSGAGTEHQV